jgi:hypothetical protein
MSKEKKVHAAVVADVVPEPTPVLTPATPPGPPPAPVLSQSPERLSEVDKLSLDLARTKRATALAEAKTALANNENSELNYKYLVLQLYMKYGLTHEDAVSEAGDIIRGGAVQRPQGQ